MTDASRAIPAPTASRPRWLMVFIFLAALNLISVGAGVWLVYQTNSAFDESIEANERWAEHLSHVSGVMALAGEVNEPGNDVFVTLDPITARRDLARARLKFDSAFEALRERLQHSHRIDADRLVESLGKIQSAMDAMGATAGRVFAAMQRGDTAGAAALMTVMDRRYADSRAGFELVRQQIRDYQLATLTRQQAIGIHLRQLQVWFSIVMVLVVVITCAYGVRMSRGAQRLADEREASRRELEFQKFAVDQATIVAVTDSDGRITYANDRFCEISGYTRDELLGRNHWSSDHDKGSKSLWAEMFATTAAGEVWHGEVRDRRKDGTPYWVHTTIIPFQQAGRITRYVAIKTDITERKEAEGRLIQASAAAEAANRAKSEFLANMSHEIRTPMTAILGFADLLNDPDTSREELVEHVATIRRNGEHLLTIINDILDLSKIESGKLDVESIDCSPTQIVEEVASLMRVRAKLKGIDLGVLYENELPRTIRSDPTRLRQILVNLVGNAIKFTDRGSVCVMASSTQVSADKASLKFKVSDSGTGMSAETVSRLFRPFTQADTSTTRTHGGTGLGLTISRRLAQLLGGDIAVSSELGRGSTFTVVLDETTAVMERSKMSDQTAGTASSRAGQKPLAGVRLLLAEDGPDNQRLISFHLKRAGAEVQLADNGRIAFDAATAEWRQARGFDAILMDMQMPEMDGYAATEALRQAGYAGPIIALTAHAMSGDREKCIAAGCDDYGTKPIDAPALIGQIVRLAAAARDAKSRAA